MSDKCPLGDDCDLTAAYMAGHERGKDTAAATITELRKEVERLRDELQTIVDSYDARSELFTTDADCAGSLADRARAALQGETK